MPLVEKMHLRSIFHKFEKKSWVLDARIHIKNVFGCFMRGDGGGVFHLGSRTSRDHRGSSYTKSPAKSMDTESLPVQRHSKILPILYRLAVGLKVTWQGITAIQQLYN